MHIAATTHEHRVNAQVYTYEGDFDIRSDQITWQAQVTLAGDEPRTLTGSIPVASPGVAAVAEESVRDAIVRRIDTLDSNEGTSPLG